MNPSEIDLKSLPSVLLVDRCQLPESPCIYFAIDGEGVVQYIGQSKNPRQRWKGHDKGIDLAMIGNVRIAYLECSADLLLEVERALIAWFLPPLNRTNTGRPRSNRKEQIVESFQDLSDFPNSMMELEDLMTLYPSLSREQISRIAGCSIALVDRWLMKGSTRKHPSEGHKARFAIAHWLWTREASEPPLFQELRRIKEEADR